MVFVLWVDVLMLCNGLECLLVVLFVTNTQPSQQNWNIHHLMKQFLCQ